MPVWSSTLRHMALQKEKQGWGAARGALRHSSENPSDRELIPFCLFSAEGFLDPDEQEGASVGAGHRFPERRSQHHRRGGPQGEFLVPVTEFIDARVTGEVEMGLSSTQHHHRGGRQDLSLLAAHKP